MFFIMGISQGKKELNFGQTMICGTCGRYGRYDVFMTYMYLSLFFIPVFKWKKQYYVTSSCCGTVYGLNPEKGRQIARGMQVQILESDLIYTNMRSRGQNRVNRCGGCGYEAEPDFEFCPKCGRRLW